MYDYLVVGSGLYGAIFAHEAKAHGKNVLVVDKRSNIAGNIYTEKIEGINVHKYGAHIFHTNNKMVWDYVNRFVEFNRFTNSPVANYKGELYSLPFNITHLIKCGESLLLRKPQRRSRNSVRKFQLSLEILKNRQFLWWDVTFMKN